MNTVETLLKNKATGFWSISPTSKVIDALKLMAEKNIGALVVVDNGKLIGIISERDYARKVALMGKSSVETSVSEIMALPVTTVTLKNTREECMVLMTSNHFRHLPVENSGQVIGLISIGDLVKDVIEDQQQTIQKLYNRF